MQVVYNFEIPVSILYTKPPTPTHFIFFGGGNFLVKKVNIDPQSISSINFVSRCII